MARKVEFIFDPIEIAGVKKSDLDPDLIKGMLKDVGDYVLQSVKGDMADTVSSVDGQSWEKLNPEYAKIKKRKGGKPIANLKLSGDMIGAMAVKSASGSKLRLFVNASEADKADGHNNHSGDSNLPLRRFVPLARDKETFRDEILSGITEIVSAALKPVESTDNPAGLLTDKEIRALVDEGVTIKPKAVK